MQQINIVWFKKDLRLTDHQPLVNAVNDQLPTLLVFFFEPSMMQHKTADVRHWRFLFESVVSLQTSLQPLQHTLYYFQNEALIVLEEIAQWYQIKNIFSHAETGHNASWDRDKLIASFCALKEIRWIESQTNGVIRPLPNRTNWNKKWLNTMIQPLAQPNLNQLKTIQLPSSLTQVIEGPPLSISIVTHNKSFQPGGIHAANSYLSGFLAERIYGYSKFISKPTEARFHSSRLSPYFTYGNLSIRQAYQAGQQLKFNTPAAKGEVSFFSSRLLWHCHFIQKFETDIAYETQNINKGFNATRTETNEALLEAWKTGQTGMPLIDASMRCLQSTGYINFRMRSMLVSFLTHHLWQPWQAGAPHLAQVFLDYEPGIHYPQIQMQAGTTGINTIRIYNPVKQAHDHDSQGVFIKKWVPELQKTPIEYLFEPWKMTIMEKTMNALPEYVPPIINVETRANFARKTLWEVKKSNATRQYNTAILKRHTQRSNINDSPLKIPFEE